MPELPDIAAYIHALKPRILEQPLQRVRLANPFLLRTVDPPITDAEERMVQEVRRIGKRIAIGVEGDLWLVLHLMIAGRLHWRKQGIKLAGRQNLAAFDFPDGSLLLTEAGSKRRASLHAIRGEEDLRAIDPGGIDVFTSTLDELTPMKFCTPRSFLRLRALKNFQHRSGNDCSVPRGILCNCGLIDLLPKPNSRFQRKLPPLEQIWRCMAVSENHAQFVAPRYNAYDMRITRRITVRRVKPKEDFLQTEDSQEYCNPISRKLWTSSRR